MSTKLLFVLALLCASFVASAAEPLAPGDPPIKKLNGILVDAKGRGLYTWDGDTRRGKSDCDGQCRLLWPPIMADANAKPKGPFDLALRNDGTKQWALKGKPLYRWKSDKKFGDAGGDGVNGTWRLVKVGVK